MVLAGRPRQAGGYGIQAGGGQFDFVQTMPPAMIGTTSTRTAQRAYLGIVRAAKPLTFTQMSYQVGAAAGTVDLGIYSFDGTNFVRVGSTGATAAAGSSNIQTIALTAPATLQPGTDYWLAYLPSDGATQTCGRGTGAFFTNVVAFKRQVIGAAIGANTLPATIAAGSATGDTIIWVMAS